MDSGETNEAWFDSPNAQVVSVTFSGLRNRLPKWSEVVVAGDNERRINEQSATTSVGWESAAQLGIGRLLAPKARLIRGETATQLRLYPTYGTVEDVDWINGWVTVRLLQSPFQHGVAIPLYEDDRIGVLKRIGQRFRAVATLATTDPAQFYIGSIRLVETEVPDDFVAELRRLTQPSREFRF
jgi:hypothetical protein